jgi:tetratricopeptide (TPR) repeat protein
MAFHLVNVTLHSAVSIFVYLLCLELGLSVAASLFAAALFVVHPVHTESVAWIAGVGDILCGLFYFSGLWAFVRYLKRQSAAWLALSMLLVFVALLSKEMAVTFPLAAILVVAMKWDELRFTFKKAALSIAPFILVTAVYLAVRVSVLGLTLPATFEDHPSTFDWITLAVWIFGHYLRYAIIPYPLAAFHPTPLYLEYRIVSTILYGLLAAGITCFLWYRRKQTPAGLLWLFMFAAMLAPVFYLKGIAGGNLFAERYLYLPTLPMMILVASLWSRLGRKAAIVSAVSLIAVFSAVTVARNLDWRNDETLYTRTLEIYPDNVYTCLSLSAVYLDEKRYSEAEKCLEIAKAHIDDPQFSHPRTEAYRLNVELGTLAARQGKASEAEGYLSRAIEINPAASDAYSILAGVRMNLERKFEESIPLLEKAIELGPSDDQARDSMGVALYNLKEYDKAVEYFRQAIQINPNSKLAQSHLETALKRLQSK